jgi:hypothetical protein
VHAVQHTSQRRVTKGGQAKLSTRESKKAPYINFSEPNPSHLLHPSTSNRVSHQEHQEQLEQEEQPVLFNLFNLTTEPNQESQATRRSRASQANHQKQILYNNTLI